MHILRLIVMTACFLNSTLEIWGAKLEDTVEREKFRSLFN